MRILKTWQSQLRERFLQKMMHQLDARRSPVPFESAHSIGVFFNANEPESRDVVLPFLDKLKKKGKNVTALGYFDHKQDVSGFSFKAFNKNDIDWMGRPKENIIESYADKDFDFLISIYTGTCLPIEYLAALSRAHFRVGPYTDNTYCYDLIIDIPEGDIKQYLKEVDFYLNKINKHHGANIH